MNILIALFIIPVNNQLLVKQSDPRYFLNELCQDFCVCAVDVIKVNVDACNIGRFINIVIDPVVDRLKKFKCIFMN